MVAGKFHVSEMFFEVPKDYESPLSGTLRLFARVVERYEKPVDPGKSLERMKEHAILPWCK